MKIIEGPYLSINDENIHFWIETEGKEILCAITALALDRDYQAKDDRLECFRENVQDILAMVEYALPSAPEVPDGTPRVVIKSKQ
ncbi:MAG: DUF1488 family protein [Paracoccaceae bacterium]